MREHEFRETKNTLKNFSIDLDAEKVSKEVERRRQQTEMAK